MQLGKLTIGRKLGLQSILGAVALAIMLAAALWIVRGSMLQDRLSKVRAIVETEHSSLMALDKQVRAGTLSKDDALKRLREINDAIRYDGNEYLFVVDLTGTMVAHGVKPELEGKNMIGFQDPSGLKIFAAFIDIARRDGQGSLEYLWPKAGSDQPVPKLGYIKLFEPWGVFIGTGIYLDDFQRDFRAFAWQLGIIVVILALVTGAISLLVGRRVAQALNRLGQGMRRLADGDLDGKVPELDRSDEIGEMAQTVQVFKENALERRRLRLDQETARERAETERREMLGTLASSFEASVKTVVETVASAATELRDNSERMSGVAEQATLQASGVAHAGDSATGSVQAVAAASEELSASFGEIARQVDDASRIAAQASTAARGASSSVESLAHLADTVGGIVRLISEIASQTNLLALNATIEAARAGEAGKGFAVVAGEVKNLAIQTANATQEITKQIQAMQAETQSTVGAVRGIVETIARVDAISAAIAAAVEQQQAATHEIARNVAQAASDTATVSQDATQVADAVGETGRSAASVLGKATTLSRESDRLRHEIEQFVARVRAA
ncbi:MAG TPA: cache domain-containing protein [Aliidongia sp.]|uniref:methyl-accepting chemotaxis protein n=1 Tax=Aliidongia sp. TaxID=1914230 RepID=UPI002DDD00FD|nr:cache domain-containing protein [Aliidongia sp.]HEV2676053.1 cache domain-containing protein [Aliidongia sp.]